MHISINDKDSVQKREICLPATGAAAAAHKGGRIFRKHPHKDQHTQPGVNGLYYQFTTKKQEVIQGNNPQHQHHFCTEQCA